MEIRRFWKVEEENLYSIFNTLKMKIISRSVINKKR